MPRGIDRVVFAKLIVGDWIDRHENLLITGATGLGKSCIPYALGHKTCRDNRSVQYPPGEVHLLTKPYRKAELAEKLRRVLDRGPTSLSLEGPTKYADQ